jgi:hypothetical protein
LHIKSLEMKEIISKNDFSKSKDLCKYLVKINLGPCIEERIKPAKTLIIIDASATKSSLISKLKNTVQIMFHRIGIILEQFGL